MPNHAETVRHIPNKRLVVYGVALAWPHAW
jgi:hypothetical protein